MMQVQTKDPICELQQKIADLNAKINLLRLEDSNFQTILLGQTGAGKSTLTNCLIENHLKWIRSGSKYCCQSDTSQGPAIGNIIGKSETTAPSKFVSSKVGTIIDNPGLEDTRGDTQDIINSYCISKMFTASKKIKLLIMIQFSDLQHSKGKKISEIISLVLKLFCYQNQDQLAASCLIVVSKILEQFYQTKQTADQIVDILSQQKRYNELRLFKKIIQKNGLLFFPSPVKQKVELNQKSIQNIRSKIMQINAYGLKKDASIQLSDKSKYYLSQIAKKCYRNLENESANISEALKKQISNIPNHTQEKLRLVQVKRAVIIQHSEHYQTAKTIEQRLQQLQIPQQIIGKTLSQLHKLQFCQQLQPNLKFPNKSKQLILQNIAQPIQYCYSKLKKNVADTKTYIERMKNVKQLQLKENDSCFQLQKQMAGYFANEQSRSEQMSSKNRQMWRESMQQIIQKNQQQQQQTFKQLSTSLQKSQWQNYKVVLQTKSVCQIM